MATSLRDLLERRVAETPDALAVDGVTWAALHDRALRVAAALVRDGVPVQARVAYLGKNDVRYFEILFGCGLAAAVPAPLNWRLAPAELEAILADSEATVLFVDPELAAPPTSATVVVLGDAYETWLGRAEDPGRAPEPGHIAFQLYTSGTTGRPKGAMFANATNLRVLTTDIADAWALAPGDVSLVVMPLFHMGGLAWALAGLASGARLVLVRDFVPGAVLDQLAGEAVTVAFCVPAMLAALCDALEAAPRELPLQRMVYSGAPISETALRRAMNLLGCDFVQIYGLTEATGAFAQLPASDHADPALLRSAGRPYPWVETRIVDAGRDVADGEVGEIWTRSEQNLVGYSNQPEETARALDPDGWLRTGDLGYRDGEGRLFLVDRAKDMIISGGENVYPAEVENVLAAFPGLASAAVIGVPSDRWGETVKAVVTARDGAAIDPDALIAFARERLAGFKCPTSVDVVDAMPLTATGKIQKVRLREPYWAGHDRRIN